MFIFMHIPKTACTTFNDFLYNNILPKNWIWITEPLEFSFISDKELNGFDYIATHAGHGFFNRITVEHKIITMLRNPVELKIECVCVLKFIMKQERF